MKKVMLLMIMITIGILFSGCQLEPPVVEPDPVYATVCVGSDNFTFYQANEQALLGNQDKWYMVTIDGDVEIPDNVYDTAMLNEYEALCYRTIDGVLDKYMQARRASVVPEPIVITETVIEYVETEVIVHTHDVIDPDDWIAMDHETYYYFVQENIVHLVYTKSDYAFGINEMFLLTIIFEPHTISSDQVMIATITQYVQGIYNGVATHDLDFVNTDTDTIVEFVEAFILTNDHTSVASMYEDGLVE